ncbi:hypothetical protein [Rhizobium ruizarguesonis]|uniref:hypothetical protein n=1 Tax=Rhizobium ruizarguesonis TaxID=2081791 RepID=UPI001031FAD4|nr:hypothetical protein [Rhizobium ruizarguesonis]TBE20532.1 hypothetical protein ELH05_28150 [Rhizobium ruizarguesonis]TCA27784.1 hypothetical protein E0H66_31760 [Rhizobium leguminosarum bv. viciae]WSH23718.1 hypothetical protein U8Q07_25755 [Rhizobium ruizarguesonis]WSH37113.1 hypothetical protein U8P70_28595 [Rhizobium ruizarguesonis]
MKSLALSLLAVFAALPAKADLDIHQMNAALGLAGVVGYADVCGYRLDQGALERYFASVGLATPEGFSYTKVNIERSSAEKPSPSECTLSKATAKSIGLLAQ